MIVSIVSCARAAGWAWSPKITRSSSDGSCEAERCSKYAVKVSAVTHIACRAIHSSIL